MIKILFIFVLTVLSSISHAATWNVMGGTFHVTDSSGGSPNGVPVIFGGNGAFDDGVFNGSASAIATDSQATYVGMDTFQYIGIDLFTYFSPSGKDGETASLSGLSGPNIDLNTMTADMTSMFANWNSNGDYVGEYNIGGIASITNLDEYNYELVWGSIQTSGPYQGLTVNMTMQVSPVPLPAAVWLFGSGLIGLTGFARRKYK